MNARISGHFHFKLKGGLIKCGFETTAYFINFLINKNKTKTNFFSGLPAFTGTSFLY